MVIVKWFQFSEEDPDKSEERSSEFPTQQEAEKFAGECWMDPYRAIHSDSLHLVPEEILNKA